MPLYLNPAYSVRPDGGRALLIKYKPGAFESPYFLYIHPLMGLVISLIDGHREEDDLVRDTAFVLNVTNDTARSFITHIFSRVVETATEPLVVTSPKAGCVQSAGRRKYGPEDFIVSHDALDFYSRKVRFPLNINFIVTNRCSCRCIYCFAERELSPITTHLPLKRVLELIGEMGENDVINMTFAGGDALEWPHIIPAIERTLHAGITPTLSTKACLSEKRCAKLAAIGVRQMQYSLDAATATTAEMMTGRRNFLSQAVSSIRSLIKAGIEVRLKSVITPYNASEVPGLLALASDVGIRLVHLVAYGRSTFRHSDALFLDDGTRGGLTKQLRLLKEHYSNLEITGLGFNDGKSPASAEPTQATLGAEEDAPSKHGVPLAIGGRAQSNAGAGENIAAGDAWAKWKHPKSICSMGRTSLTILPDGGALMCEQLPSEPRFIVGSVAHSSIRELWTSSDFSNRTLRPDRELFRGRVCHECPEFVWCHEVRGRCIRDAYKAYGDPYQSDPRCPRALPGARLE